jgi:hypothetical protein
VAVRGLVLEQRLVPVPVRAQQQVAVPEQQREAEVVQLVELVQPQGAEEAVPQLPGRLVLPEAEAAQPLPEEAEAAQRVLVLPEEASAGTGRRTAGAEEEFA